MRIKFPWTEDSHSAGLISRILTFYDFRREDTDPVSSFFVCTSVAWSERGWYKLPRRSGKWGRLSVFSEYSVLASYARAHYSTQANISSVRTSSIGGYRASVYI